MTRFTKATLIVAALVLAAAAWAWLVGQAYIARGGWNVGGEWLVPAVGVAAWGVTRELRNICRMIKKEPAEKSDRQ